MEKTHLTAAELAEIHPAVYEEHVHFLLDTLNNHRKMIKEARAYDKKHPNGNRSFVVSQLIMENQERIFKEFDATGIYDKRMRKIELESGETFKCEEPVKANARA